MPQPRQVEQLAADLLALYQHSWDRITAAEQAVLADWLKLNRTQRLARLRALQATVEHLMDTVDEQATRFVNDRLPIRAAGWTGTTRRRSRTGGSIRCGWRRSSSSPIRAVSVRGVAGRT
jgi:hypothetical protein